MWPGLAWPGLGQDFASCAPPVSVFPVSYLHLRSIGACVAASVNASCKLAIKKPNYVKRLKTKNQSCSPSPTPQGQRQRQRLRPASAADCVIGIMKSRCCCRHLKKKEVLLPPFNELRLSISLKYLCVILLYVQPFSIRFQKSALTQSTTPQSNSLSSVIVGWFHM